MKENSIEDRINNAYCFLNSMHSDFRTGLYYKEDLENLEHILSDYKRVLKINEVLLKENEELHKEIDRMKSLDIYKLVEDWKTGQLIPIQKIKDIIDRIDYDIKKTKEIISNEQINNYRITRLKAMNTKSLDIKNRLQELLESEE